VPYNYEPATFEFPVNFGEPPAKDELVPRFDPLQKGAGEGPQVPNNRRGRPAENQGSILQNLFWPNLFFSNKFLCSNVGHISTKKQRI
jgi:hypothetical protein